MVASSPTSHHGPDMGSVATSHIGGGAVWWKSPSTALARGRDGQPPDLLYGVPWSSSPWMPTQVNVPADAKERQKG